MEAIPTPDSKSGFAKFTNEIMRIGRVRIRASLSAKLNLIFYSKVTFFVLTSFAMTIENMRIRIATIIRPRLSIEFLPGIMAISNSEERPLMPNVE